LIPATPTPTHHVPPTESIEPIANVATLKKAEQAHHHLVEPCEGGVSPPSRCRAARRQIARTINVSRHTKAKRAHRRRVEPHNSGATPPPSCQAIRRRTNPPPACRATRGGIEPTANVSSRTKAERVHHQRVEPHEGGASPPPACRATQRWSEPTVAVSSYTKVSPARDVEDLLPAWRPPTRKCQPPNEQRGRQKKGLMNSTGARWTTEQSRLALLLFFSFFPLHVPRHIEYDILFE
jgi:hypothetical protein